MPTIAQLIQAFRSLPGRWLCVFGGILLQVCYDFNATYAMVSPSLQKNKKFSVEFFHPFSSKRLYCSLWYPCCLPLLADHRARHLTPHSFVARFGLLALFILAPPLLFGGYLFIWLDLPNVHESHKALYHLFTIFISFPSSAINGTNTVLSITNFPTHGGLVVALMKAYFELSVSIAELNKVFFDGNLRFLILAMGVAPLVASVASILLMRFRLSQNDPQNVDKIFCKWYFVSSVVTALMVMSLSIADKMLHFMHHRWVAIVADCVVLVGIAFPLLVHYLRVARAAPDATATVDATVDDTAVAASATATAAEQNAGGDVPSFPNVLGNKTFWFVCLSTVCTLPTAKSLFNNLHMFGPTLSMKESEIHNIISIYSACSFAGSLTVGGLSDVVLFKYGVGRPWFMALTSLIMVGGHILVTTDHMIVGACLVGAAFGGYLGLLPVIFSELFSVKKMSYLLPTVEVANAGFTFLFTLSVTLSEKKNCLGISCFKTSYILYTAICSFGFVFTLIVGFLTQNVYSPMAQHNG